MRGGMFKSSYVPDEMPWKDWSRMYGEAQLAPKRTKSAYLR